MGHRAMSITSDRMSRLPGWLVVGLAAIGGIAGAAPLDDVRSLVVQKTWTEQGPDESGVPQSREVTAEIWTAAFQRRIDETKRLEIPARAEPYYVDGPLVLPSGSTIVAAPEAEIRLVPGANTCIVRNANLVGFSGGPVPADLQPDTDITIEGGIWTTTLATTADAPQGNVRGHSAHGGFVAGTHGVILLHNVCGARIGNVTIRESRPFAIHLGNVKDFLVDGLKLDHTHRDGVHVSGPASDGLIRNVRGVSKDDPVALTAWDWRQYAPSFGPEMMNVIKTQVHDILLTIRGSSRIAIAWAHCLSYKLHPSTALKERFVCAVPPHPAAPAVAQARPASPWPARLRRREILSLR